MENVEEHHIKIFFKKFWTKVKPFLPAIALGVAIIAVVILLTYMYFACSFGFIPSDRIVDKDAIKKSDWLMFWGSILAVFCTLSLALVSYRQNKDLQKINDDREQKDTYFAKLRFAAEFYSMIDFASLYVEERENNDATLTLNIIESGKVPANEVKFLSFTISPSENIEKFLASNSTSAGLCTIEPVIADIKSSDRQETLSIEKPRGKVSVNINEANYNNLKGMCKAIFIVGTKNKDQNIFLGSTLQANIIYSLANPLEVETLVVCRMSLSIDFGDFTLENEKKEYHFSINDMSNSAITYDYVGEVK